MPYTKKKIFGFEFELDNKPFETIMNHHFSAIPRLKKHRRFKLGYDGDTDSADNTIRMLRKELIKAYLTVGYKVLMFLIIGFNVLLVDFILLAVFWKYLNGL